jgi:acetyl-CoA synthetase
VTLPDAIASRRAFIEARDLLLRHRSDYATAKRDFRWPALGRFNWALDHFDHLQEMHSGPALIVRRDDSRRLQLSFADLSARSNQVAELLAENGVRRGDRVQVTLPNIVELWEAMLACIKLGAVIVPATVQLTQGDIEDRIARGGVKHVGTDASGRAKIDAVSGFSKRFLVGGEAPGFVPYAASGACSTSFAPPGETLATDPMLLYFTSGTTAKPKLVVHTHQSYPVGHLSTMYWLGLQPGDVHWNISSPGWAKHAWSNVFAPWNAGATVFVHDTARFIAKRALELLKDENIDTLCAPPTVWRMLILEDLALFPNKVRELCSAGEPLNPEVIGRVEKAWGRTIRDGFGQTETTALVGNPPGQKVIPGSMGRALPGYEIFLAEEREGHADGEVSIGLSPRPIGLMVGYEDDPELTAQAMRDGRYHTGDVFKASDYRISPFELESVLLEHPAVAEAAVVPSPDALRLAVPKAFVVLKPARVASDEIGRAIMQFVRERVPPYKRIKRLEFVAATDTVDAQGLTLPKTISGKIRRVELRERETSRAQPLVRGAHEIWDD